MEWLRTKQFKNSTNKVGEKTNGKKNSYTSIAIIVQKPIKIKQNCINAANLISFTLFRFNKSD